MNDAELTFELTSSKATLETLTGEGRVLSFATPYGAYDARVITEILKYYQSQRGTDAGYNTLDTANFDNIRVQNMLATTTLAEYQSWLDQAINNNAWLVLIYHRVANDPGTYDTKIDDFQAQMATVYGSGITVLSVSSAIAEITPQLQIA